MLETGFHCQFPFKNVHWKTIRWFSSPEDLRNYPLFGNVSHFRFVLEVDLRILGLKLSRPLTLHNSGNFPLLFVSIPIPCPPSNCLLLLLVYHSRDNFGLSLMFHLQLIEIPITSLTDWLLHWSNNLILFPGGDLQPKLISSRSTKSVVDDDHNQSGIRLPLVVAFQSHQYNNRSEEEEENCSGWWWSHSYTVVKT